MSHSGANTGDDEDKVVDVPDLNFFRFQYLQNANGVGSDIHLWTYNSCILKGEGHSRKRMFFVNTKKALHQV